MEDSSSSLVDTVSSTTTSAVNRTTYPTTILLWPASDATDPEESDRAQFVVNSDTTALQSATEDECLPFFLGDPSTLSESQYSRLHSMGMVDVFPWPSSSSIDNDHDHDHDSKDVSMEAGAPENDDCKKLAAVGQSGRRFLAEFPSGCSSPSAPTSRKRWSLNGGGPYRYEYDRQSSKYGSSLPSWSSSTTSVTSKSSLCTEETPPSETRAGYCLLREKHIRYCRQGLLSPLSSAYVSLDSSRPWMIYWNLHSLDLLGALDDLPSERLLDVVNTLRMCAMSGGTGGTQMAHGATAYASVMALTIVATCDGPGRDAARAYLKEIRGPLYRWYYRLRLFSPEGMSFRMHDDGESDVRATYTVLAVSTLLRLPFPEEVASFVEACQTYEGGYGGEPGTEAHGGYTYCAVASLALLGLLGEDPSLRAWLSRRQVAFEGGFNGRTHKLVDGCYSFWIGASAALTDLKFDTVALQRYLIHCAQCNEGGLRDKPSKHRDFYHTCYGLSGLSVAQNFSSSEEVVYGHPRNLVEAVDPRYNLRKDRVACLERFWDQEAESLPLTHEELMAAQAIDADTGQPIEF